MGRVNKTPEHKIVYDIKWQGGNVTNDAHTLHSKGIKSPAKEKMYAVAFLKSEKKEIWFASEERLRKWKMTTTFFDYTIKMIDHEKEEPVGYAASGSR